MSRAGLRWALLGLLGLVLIGGLLAFNYRLALRWPGGAAFWPLWRGAQALLLHGESPYTPPGGPTPPWALGHTFDLPPFAVVLLAPYALAPSYPWARALWMLTLEMALLLTAWAAWGAWRWNRRGRLGLAAAALLLGPWGVAAVVEGRVAVLLLPVAVLAAYAWRRGWTWGAAWLAAWLWLRPALFGPWMLVWALGLLSRPRGRRALAAWLVASASLFALGTLLQPGWFPAYLEAWVRSHLLRPGPVWGLPHTLALSLPGLGKLAWAVALAAGVWLLAELVAAWGKSWLHLVWTAHLALVLTPYLGLPVAPAQAVIWVLPWLLVWALWDQRWLYGPRAVVLSALGTWGLAWAWVGSPSDPTAITLPPGLAYGVLPLLGMFGLYFVRWWATHADWWAEGW